MGEHDENQLNKNFETSTHLANLYGNLKILMCPMNHIPLIN